MATRVDIVDLDDGRATLRVQYGREKTARIQIVLPVPAHERQTTAEICRIEIHELADALDEWSQESENGIGDLRQG